MIIAILACCEILSAQSTPPKIIDSAPGGAAVFLQSRGKLRFLGHTPFEFKTEDVNIESIFKILITKPGYKESNHVLTNTSEPVTFNLIRSELVASGDERCSGEREQLRAGLNQCLYAGDGLKSRISLKTPVRLIPLEKSCVALFELYIGFEELLDPIRKLTREAGTRGSDTAIAQLVYDQARELAAPIQASLDGIRGISTIDLTITFPTTQLDLGFSRQTTQHLHVKESTDTYKGIKKTTTTYEWVRQVDEQTELTPNRGFKSVKFVLPVDPLRTEAWPPFNTAKEKMLVMVRGPKDSKFFAIGGGDNAGQP